MTTNLPSTSHHHDVLKHYVFFNCYDGEEKKHNEGVPQEMFSCKDDTKFLSESNNKYAMIHVKKACF